MASRVRGRTKGDAMTGAHDLHEFDRALADLAAAYGKAVTDAMKSSYWSGLEDLALEAVRDGMALAKRDSRYLPPVSVIRDCARQAEQADSARLTVGPRPIPESDVWCSRCDDTGWRYVDAPAPEPLLSDAYRSGLVRTKAERCACRADNPVYQWRRAAERRQGARRERES